MKIGDYELGRAIGTGGTGTVFRARSAAGREVALKVLASRAGSREGLARFEREARLLATFTEEEGFVPLLDVLATPQGPALVMPLIAGGTLRARLDERPFSIEETAALGRALGAALGRAHARGIIHRDLKPENVLLQGERPLIADLGLAKHFSHEGVGASASVRLSRTGDFRGTAGYMAPEQMLDAANVGPPADVFALGAILYECLAGVPAIQGRTLVEAVTRTQQSRIPPLRKHRSDVPPWLAAIIERCLARDPKKRFADGAALAAALARGAEGAPASGGRSRLLAVLGLALGVSILVALLIARRPSGQGGPSAAGDGSPPHEPPAVVAPRAPGEEALARCDFARARAELEKILERAPQDARALALHGEALLGAGDVAGAAKDFARALEIDAGSAPAHLGLAKTHFLHGDLARARTEADEAVRLAPKLAAAYEVRAVVRLHQVDPEGKRDLEHATVLDPKTPGRWLSGEGGCALAGVATVLALHLRSSAPSGAWAHILIALNALDEDGRDDDAALEASKAVKVEPSLGAAWTLRALVASWRDSNLEAAFADAEKGLKLEPSAAAFAVRADIRSKYGDAVGALADADHALALDAREPRAWRARARSLASAGDIEAAIACVESSLAVLARPKDRERAHAQLRLLQPLTDIDVEVPWADGLLPEAPFAASDPRNWSYVINSPTFPGHRALSSAGAPGPQWAEHAHAALGVVARRGERLFSWVHLDANDMPREVVLEWAEPDGTRHAAFWGEDLIPLDATKRWAAGPLTVPGNIERYEVAASDLGLEDRLVTTFTVRIHGGRVTFGVAGKRRAF